MPLESVTTVPMIVSPPEPVPLTVMVGTLIVKALSLVVQFDGLLMAVSRSACVPLAVEPL